MRRLATCVFFAASSLAAAPASESIEKAIELERQGKAAEAKAALSEAAQANADDPQTQLAYAELLDRYRDPRRLEAYDKAVKAFGASGDQGSRRRATARLAVLAAAAGDAASAQRALEAYRAAGGKRLQGAAVALDASSQQDLADYDFAPVPGARDSFLRMAALSTDLDDSELLGALGRNVVTGGYRSSRGTETMQQTEYLKLLLQYLSQARELEQLAGANQTIDVPTCESSETAQLLKILGFRLRNECGPEAVIETVNPSRAFLSIDSAFPLPDLEEAYRRDEEYHLAFAPLQLPVLFGPEYWSGAARNSGKGLSFIETFLNDPALARLYVALSKMHRPTALALKDEIPAERLKAYAHVLDFFGEMYEIRNGSAVVPGDAATWQKLAGAAPSEGPEFFLALSEADDGWLAAFFDSLLRANPESVAYYTEPARIQRFYGALRGDVTSPGPARPIFRSNAELMLLTSRMVVKDGAAYIPGGIKPWSDLFVEHPHGKYDGKLTKSAAGWSQADDVVEAMFALCRKAITNEPLRIFLAATAVDRNRSTPLSPEMANRLILAFPRYGDQFSLFNDAPDLSEQTMAAVLDMMERIDDIRNLERRADATGGAQALMSLWQIFVRQGQIPPDKVDSTLRTIVDDFGEIRSSQDFFDAARGGVQELLAATGTAPDASPQDRLIQLLAGSPAAGEEEVHKEVAERLSSLFNQQRLVSIKTLLDMGDHLERVSRGESFNVAMTNRHAATISEVRLPNVNLSTAESNALARGDWVEKHISRQRDMNLRRTVDRAQGRPTDLLEIRGDIAPVLRDALVGVVYAYYSPPGAELIRANPLFVRSHDFLGPDGKRAWGRTRSRGSGWPNSGGGRLIGSLAGLPYGMNDAEQNFLVPTERQALIWQDLAPQVLLGATVPRWWDVSRTELHFVGLHLRMGEELAREAALDSELRQIVASILSTRVEPARRWRMDNHFASGRIAEGARELAPAEYFYLAKRLLAEHRELTLELGAPFAAEIERLAKSEPRRTSDEHIGFVFGTPHPELSRSYRPQLLNLPLFPTLMGYSSRVMAESWESTNLYWAALADEAHLEPAQLNLRVPEWTRLSLERIFATHLEDWPALLRSMRIIGERYRSTLQPGEKASTLAALD